MPEEKGYDFGILPPRDIGETVDHFVECISRDIHALDMEGPKKQGVRGPGLGPCEVTCLRDTLYSDLLLHDMGDELADHRPDGSATGREWRTTPLWGLRLMEDFLDGQAFLMHDGRARSVDEAIMLHGGEAAAVRAAYSALSATEKAALLDFVRSR